MSVSAANNPANATRFSLPLWPRTCDASPTGTPPGPGGPRNLVWIEYIGPECTSYRARSRSGAPPCCAKGLKYHGIESLESPVSTESKVPRLAFVALAIVCLGGAFGQRPVSVSTDGVAALIRQDRLREAREALEGLIAQTPDPPADAYYHLAVCDAREGNRQAADKSLDLALSRNPDFLPALHLKAYLQFSAGRYTEALEWARQFLQKDPDGGETRKVSGLARFMLGDRAGAERELQRASILLPRDFDAHYYLGRVYFEKSKLSLALESFRSAIQVDPHSVKAHNHLGQTLEGLTHFEEAKDAYQNAIELEEEGKQRSEWPYYNLGTLLLAEGDAEQAVTLLERALERNPSSMQTRTKLGAAYSAASQLENARQQLREAVLAEPSNADAHYQLGRVLMKLGLEDQARKHLALFERLREP